MRLQYTAAQMPRRLRIRVRGCVQGVGFRPYIYAMARRFSLDGFVRNDSQGVLIEIEGARIEEFLIELRVRPPMLARIDALDAQEIPSEHREGFYIQPSAKGAAWTRIPADAAICDSCLDDVFNPASRFHHYPFTACAQCGPRFSIARRLPYDRSETAMAEFPMCAACARDYADPDNRRFHAQPIACPHCGPRLSHPPECIAAALNDGKIVALKGIGGYHLLCDAANPLAIQELRRRKRRDEKPFAVMIRNAASLDFFACPTQQERALFESAPRPITLMTHKGVLPDAIAPGLSRIGLMAPYMATHHLIFHFLCGDAARDAATPRAFVATSANLSGAPLISDNEEAETKLAPIADLIVSHNRAIVAPIDDSVAAIFNGAPGFMRRARGYVAEPIDLGTDGPSILACGGHFKSTITATRGREAFVSQYIGDLENAATYRRYCECVEHFLDLLNIAPEAVACDAHPDFLSRRYAEETGLPLFPVQHHAAHIASVVGEHGVSKPVLGLALDGYGLGADGGAWGGELIFYHGGAWRRLGHLAPLAMPGGDRAAREAWRMGISALAAINRLDAAPDFFQHEPQCAALIRHLEQNGERAPTPPLAGTTSMGRLFDAVAALLGLAPAQAYEGQAAMLLEAQVKTPRNLPDGFELNGASLSFAPFFRFLIEERPTMREGAELFHGTAIEGLAQWVVAASEYMDTRMVALGGGCMMNRILAEGLCDRLRALGFTPLSARAVPANDGGLSLGQAVMARALAARLANG